MLCGFHNDLAAQMTHVSNRLRGFLTQTHPSLERVLGPKLPHPAVNALLCRYPCPQRLAAAGRGHVVALLRKHAPRLVTKLTEEIFDALGQQSEEITDTGAAGKIFGRLAAQLQQRGAQRADIAVEILAVVDAHPLTEVEDIHAGGGCQDSGQDPHRGGGQGLR